MSEKSGERCSLSQSKRKELAVEQKQNLDKSSKVNSNKSNTQNTPETEESETAKVSNIYHVSFKSPSFTILILGMWLDHEIFAFMSRLTGLRNEVAGEISNKQQ